MKVPRYESITLESSLRQPNGDLTLDGKLCSRGVAVDFVGNYVILFAHTVDRHRASETFKTMTE